MEGPTTPIRVQRTSLKDSGTEYLQDSVCTCFLTRWCVDPTSCDYGHFGRLVLTSPYRCKEIPGPLVQGSSVDRFTS